MTKDELKIAVGKRIVELCTNRGWSQPDLARACDKDRQAIEKIENRKVNAILYSLYEIALGLEIKLNDLLDFNEFI